MAIQFAGVRPSLHFIYSILTLIQVLLSKHRVLCDPNKFYHMSTLCLREKHLPMYKKIDGAVLSSKSEDNLECILTFQADTVLQRFMLRFEELALECNDHLSIYDGAHSFGTPRTNLSCRNTQADVGTIFTQSSFLTIKYKTGPWSKPGEGFRLVITAFKDNPSVGCNQFKCLNTFCISLALACDNVNHCGDNSDETSHALCIPENEPNLIFGVPANFFIGLAFLVFVACLICVLTLAFYLCRRGYDYNQQQHLRIGLQTSTPALAHPASYTGTMGATLSPASQRYATLPLEKIRDKPPPYPGNMFTPAAGNNTNSSNHVLVGNASPGIQQVVYYATK